MNENYNTKLSFPGFKSFSLYYTYVSRNCTFKSKNGERQWRKVFKNFLPKIGFAFFEQIGK